MYHNLYRERPDFDIHNFEGMYQISDLWLFHMIVFHAKISGLNKFIYKMENDLNLRDRFKTGNDDRPKFTLNSNLEKSSWCITSILILKSFSKLALSTAVILSCTVQKFKTI